MSLFTCRVPKAADFSFARSVENSSGNGWWMRRAIYFLCGFSGAGWYFGFIRYDKDEKLIEESKGPQS